MKHPELADQKEPNMGTTEPSTQRAWLIERAGTGGPEWFFCRVKGDDGVYAFGWSSNASEAVKFETKEEGDAWCRHLAGMVPDLVHFDTTVTEHEWMSGPC